MTAWYKKNPAQLDELIENAILELAQYSPETAEYKDALDALERLKDLQRKDTWQRPSLDTALYVAGTMAAIGLTWMLEEKHVLRFEPLKLFSRKSG